jgi:hypothetical protein
MRPAFVCRSRRFLPFGSLARLCALLSGNQGLDGSSNGLGELREVQVPTATPAAAGGDTSGFGEDGVIRR